MKEAWHNPYAVGLVGLALMIAGWKVGSLSSEVEGPDATAHRLDVAREQAEKGDLSKDPKTVAVTVPRRPPYRLVGRITFYAGLLLFVVAAVQMWTQPVPPKEDGKNEEATEELPEHRAGARASDDEREEHRKRLAAYEEDNGGEEHVRE